MWFALTIRECRVRGGALWLHLSIQAVVDWPLDVLYTHHTHPTLASKVNVSVRCQTNQTCSRLVFFQCVASFVLNAICIIKLHHYFKVKNTLFSPMSYKIVHIFFNINCSTLINNAIFPWFTRILAVDHLITSCVGGCTSDSTMCTVNV